MKTFIRNAMLAVMVALGTITQANAFSGSLSEFLQTFPFHYGDPSRTHAQVLNNHPLCFETGWKDDVTSDGRAMAIFLCHVEQSVVDKSNRNGAWQNRYYGPAHDAWIEMSWVVGADNKLYVHETSITVEHARAFRTAKGYGFSEEVQVAYRNLINHKNNLYDTYVKFVNFEDVETEE